ncbi:DUF4349 domain-containing protein [Mesobacillus maritimus]|uniref:DUF4349 domain-containing protein n=1 Tax=Mesobacillus maritimus TaxID=1643336 RepID=UPI00203F2976|nr:DUF4349 domain-containing protein [Mesobacillus maritimus]MCM3667587.1 DUF4349 domain-containing protein [Mesobacillus maritimus]
MKTKQLLLFLLLIASVVSACSNQGENQSYSTEKEDSGVEEKHVSLSMDNKASEANKVEEQLSKEERQTSDSKQISNSRMVIHNADLELKVKNYSKTQEAVESKAIEYGGYLVESSTSHFNQDQLSGRMTFRIPEQKFFPFLNDIESAAAKVINRHVTGQDVTEEYVDLESRLRSKQSVEKRLMEFMKNAKETEDLLKISSDLAKVQEEIEQLMGRMHYLENQTAFSTVSIGMEETEIEIPSFENQDLNTWQKVKKQFVLNINWLQSFLSACVVFILGNLPVIILIGGILAGSFLFIRRQKQRKKD